jgi:glycosyltransferase involved in cell wall biosynthesis
MLLPPAIARFSNPASAVIHAGVDYGFFSARPGRRLVVTFHNYVLDRYMLPFSSRLQWLHYRSDLRTFTRLSLRHADVVTAVSEATASLVREDLGYRGELIVIPNGIDTRAFQPQATTRKDGFVALFSGNLTTRKGAHWLPAIAAGLEEGQKIVCIGLRHAGTEGNNRIEFRSPVGHSDMPSLYACSHALLMPTVREGMSLAALEAMACGLPIVATDCPSMRELIEEGRGGFLCGLGKANLFAERLRWLADHPEAAIRMGAFNRQRALAHHEARTMAQRYDNLFSAIASS